jgi:hypothetical protein
MAAGIRMTTLRRARNGDWFARKRIPDDIRSAYLKAHGKGQEERFRLSAALSPGIATQEFRDWDAEISSRIERLRAKERGEGEGRLTPRQAQTLAGQWYSWFIAQHEEDPGTVDEWGIVADDYDEVCLRLRSRNDRTDLLGEDEPRTLAERDAIHRVLARRGDVDRFLRAQDRALSDTAMHGLLDVLEGEFPAALRLLSRRAEGDWSRDYRTEKFPQPAASPSVLLPAQKLSGLTVWSAFELWIEGRQPAAASINRWRAVFVNLRESFADRDAARITTEEAQQWADSLTSADRSPHVVDEVWLRAARVIFGWAVSRKRLQANPFAEVSVALPKRPAKLREREFKEDEWRTVLKATLERPPPRMEPHNAAARRWVPWICAYTGARPGEACQLRAEDIRQHPKYGFWYARITPEAGTVKGNEAREVPLHSHLIEQGFAAFAEGQMRGWPAAGSVDTEIGCFRKREASDAEAQV